MAAVFTHQVTSLTVTPLLLQTRTAQVTPGTVVRFPIGSASPYVTLGPTSLRSGEHILFFGSASDAATALTRLSAQGAIVLAYAEQTIWNMRFVVTSEMVVEQDEDSLIYWTLRFGFQEVAA